MIAMCILPFLLLILFKPQAQNPLALAESARENLQHERLPARIARRHARDGSLRARGGKLTIPSRRRKRRYPFLSWMHAIQINNAFWPALDITGTVGTVLVYYVRRGNAWAKRGRGLRSLAEPLADPVVSGPVLGAAQHAFELLQQHSVPPRRPWSASSKLWIRPIDIPDKPDAIGPAAHRGRT